MHDQINTALHVVKEVLKDVKRYVCNLRRRNKGSEIFSPTRTTIIADNMGLIRRRLIYISTTDDSNNNWDSSKANLQQKAVQLIQEELSELIVAAPPCTEYCKLNTNINHVIMVRSKVKITVVGTMRLFRFAMRM